MTAPARAQAASWWVPPLGNQPWQWELDQPLSLSSASDMGTDDKLPDGKFARAPVILTTDGIINPSTATAIALALTVQQATEFALFTSWIPAAPPSSLANSP